MLQASRALKKILDILPLDGSKLKLGTLLLLLGQLPYVLPGLDLIEIIKAIMANPTKAGVVAVFVGALHKILKAKFPSVEI